ncbi:hypothetical protein ES692_08855 [Psychroserpens burtonensis]|uniref:Uncharacterized protein n=1 Tax=Psychroserpens burtonensis TaxID=49278 RepID=A0A5C7B936_9FLAO|nr:hypothetical protein [Psychroserpens burtonensis]TXE17663.1 hypothetical protein ES692_08855 [Psychroserpens burtonensis]
MIGDTTEDILKWWEPKRLWFNIAVSFFSVLALVRTNQFSFLTLELFGVVLWGLLANVLFSTGIIIELLDAYYFKGKLSVKNFRWLFYISGTLLYCAWSFVYVVFYYMPDF